MNSRWESMMTGLVITAIVLFVTVVCYKAHKGITRRMADTPRLEARAESIEARVAAIEYRLEKQSHYMEAILSNCVALAEVVAGQQKRTEETLAVCSNMMKLVEIQTLDTRRPL